MIHSTVTRRMHRRPRAAQAAVHTLVITAYQLSRHCQTRIGGAGLWHEKGRLTTDVKLIFKLYSSYVYLNYTCLSYIGSLPKKEAKLLSRLVCSFTKFSNLFLFKSDLSLVYLHIKILDKFCRTSFETLQNQTPVPKQVTNYCNFATCVTEKNWLFVSWGTV